MPKFAIVFIYSCCTFSTYSSFPQRPKRIPPTRPCSRPRYPQSRKFLLLCRHHPPSHCCFSHWYHWFGRNPLLLCGASTKQARLPQRSQADEALDCWSNEPVAFVDFRGLVSNIFNEGPTNPTPHTAKRSRSSCCGSASLSSSSHSTAQWEPMKRPTVPRQSG